MSEDKVCPFCGAASLGNTYHIPYKCGSILHRKSTDTMKKGWERSGICYQNQLSQQDQEIKQLREIIRVFQWFPKYHKEVRDIMEKVGPIYFAKIKDLEDK